MIHSKALMLMIYERKNVQNGNRTYDETKENYVENFSYYK